MPTDLLVPDAAAPAGGPLADRAVVRRVLPVLLPPLVMAVMGFWGIGLGSALSNDESATMWAGRHLSLGELLHLLGHVDAVHGLYYLFIHCWSGVVGGTPTDLRVPSVLALSAAAGVLAAIGRRLTGSTAVGFCAGLILALTPSVSYYAQTARPYALVYLVVITGTLALLRALDEERAAGSGAAGLRRWVGYAGLVTLAGYLNELALAVVVAHGVTLYWARVPRRTVYCWLAASGAGALLVVPLIALSSGQTGQVGWLIVPDAGSARTLFHAYFGAFTPIAGLLVVLAVVGAAVWRRADPGQPDGAVTLSAVAVPLLVVPAVVLAIASVVVRPLFDERYVFYAEAGAALLAAGGAVVVGRRIRSVRLRWVAAAALCAVVFGGQLADQQAERDPISRGGYVEVADFVAANAHRGDGLVFVQDFYRKIRLAYPARFRDLTDLTLDTTPVEAGDFRGTYLPISRTRRLLLAHGRVWTVGLWTPDGQPPAAHLRGAAAYLAVRAAYRPVQLARFADLSVCLWVRR